MRCIDHQQFYALAAGTQFHTGRKACATQTDNAGLLDEFAQAGRLHVPVVKGGMICLLITVPAIGFDDDTVCLQARGMRDGTFLYSNDGARA